MEIIAWGPVLIWVWAPTLVGVAWGAKAGGCCCVPRREKARAWGGRMHAPEPPVEWRSMDQQPDRYIIIISNIYVCSLDNNALRGGEDQSKADNDAM